MYKRLMQILLFTKNSQIPPKFPNRPGLQVRYIKFESTELDDLLLIAKHKILNFPMSVIVDDNGKAIIKMYDSIPDDYVDAVL